MLHAIIIAAALTKSKPKRLHVCCIIFVSHFSLGSGGGVPAIGCGLGRVTVPRFVVFAERRGSEVVNVAAAAAAAATTALEAGKRKKDGKL